MSDPKPETTPDTTDPDGTPVENPSTASGADDPDGLGANEVNPDVPWIDPTGS